MAKAAHEDTVPGKLTQVAARELEDLRRDAVLLHQGLLERKASVFKLQDFYLGEVELEGVICGEGHVEAPGKGFSFILCSMEPNCQL